MLREYRCGYEYEGRRISYSLWKNGDGHVDRVIFLGNMQIGRLAQVVAQRVPKGTVVVEGAPHWLARRDGSDIEEYMAAFSIETFRAITRQFDIDRVDVICESQSVPSVIKMFCNPEFRTRLRGLVILQPLGLNSRVFGDSDIARMQELKIRTRKNLRHQVGVSLTDPMLWYSHGRMLSRMLFDTEKASNQYTAGLRHDMSKDLLQLGKDHRNISIVCSGNDELFKPDEIIATLNENHINIPVAVVDGVPHSPLATKLGLRLLAKAWSILHYS